MHSIRFGKFMATASLGALSLMLTACGGGGGTNSTPTPPATPSPAPMPTPAPSASYESFSTLAQPKAFTAHVARVDFRSRLNAIDIVEYSYSEFVNNLDSNTGLITYDRSNGSYTIKTSVGEKMFTAADRGARYDEVVNLNSSNIAYEVYTPPIPDGNSSEPYTDDRLIVLTPNFLVPSKENPNYKDVVELSYTKFVEWRHMLVATNTGDAQSNNILEKRSFAVFGLDTTDADMPRTGKAEYDGYVRGTYVRGGATDTGASLNLVDLGGFASFTADFSAGTVQTQLDLSKWATNNGDFSFGTLAGAGTLGAANIFSGQLAGSNGAEGYTGSYIGGFFGPAAMEMGLTFSASNADSRVVGAVVGMKK